MFLSRIGVGVYSAEAGAESESEISDSVHLWNIVGLSVEQIGDF